MFGIFEINSKSNSGNLLPSVKYSFRIRYLTMEGSLIGIYYTFNLTFLELIVRPQFIDSGHKSLHWIAKTDPY